MDKHEHLVQTCEEYLKGRGSTLWGQAHNIHEEAPRRKAAEWLASQVEGLDSLLRKKMLRETRLVPGEPHA